MATTYEAERKRDGDRQPSEDSVVWFDLVMRCPACLSEGKEPGPASQWYHAVDGGVAQVGDNAEYQCKSCSHHSHAKNWRYACQEHQTDFRPTSSQHLANALSIGGQMASQGGRHWMQRFLENLGEW